MGKPVPTPPPTPDPLADLREPSGPVLPVLGPKPGEPPVLGPQTGGPVPGAHDPIGSRCTLTDCQETHDPEPVIQVRPMVDQETHDEMVAEMVAAWHHDPTSQGFLHGGGSVCGCFYIARHALQAAVPVMTEADQEERELEPASD